MAQDISGLYISQSFQNLVQRSASGAFNVLATATGTEFIPVSASYAISASKADSAVSASYALSSSRAVSASRADSALSASYALSSSYAVTASFALNTPTNNLQEVLTAGNSASVNMILTSSLLTTSSLTEHKNEFKVIAQDKDTDLDVASFIVKNNNGGVTKITGSVNISGSTNIVGQLKSGAASNAINNNNKEVAIIAGENNTIGASVTYGAIIGATRGDLDSSDASVIAGGFRNTAGGQYNAIIGGTLNEIQSGGAIHKSNAIVGGEGNQILSSVSRSVVLGGSGITASLPDNVFMPAFKANASSTVGDVSGASANLDIGSGTNPNRYGNFQIYQNSDTHTGNYFSAFQILDGGGLTAALANSAFTGLGNEIHYVSLGANSPGRSDNIKLYASGSDTALNTPSNVNIIVNDSGNDPTLTIEDKANNSFSLGPKIKFTGSRVGKLETGTNMNLQMDIGQDFIQNIDRQYTVTLGNFTSGDFKIDDQGSRSARYIHENVVETGSIRFANTTEDVGIGLRMDDNQLALQMYSGSAFHPIIRRASGSQQVNLYDSSRSTGSSAQVLTSNANGGIEWGAAAGNVFPYTGSAIISGSLGITGSMQFQFGGTANTYNSNDTFTVGRGTTNNGNYSFAMGNSHNIQSGETSVILGGESNTVNSSYVGIFGAASSTITNGDTSVILGGYQNEVQGARSYTIGGNDNKIQNSGAEFSGIIGGQNHRILSAVTASAIIGGKSITATKNETVYMPGLEVTKLGANITGSVVGSAGGAFGQSAGAFSSDAILLGNATTPVQYGNIQIHQNTTTNAGNYFNGLQIVDAGGVVTELANSAFTGKGNNIQYLQMGAQNAGQSDAIKLWCSGSSDVLHINASASFDEVVVLMPNLPTSNPGVTGQLWNDSGTLKIS